MYVNTAYLKNTLIAPRTPLDQANTKVPLQILCCGVYRIISYPVLDTPRPNGRMDYQLLYFHSGQGHFFFEDDEHETIVSAGQIVLFRPGDRQVYYYYASDKTEVYWVHFTGYQVEELLNKYELSPSQKVFKSGVFVEYKDIFLKMITELQLCNSHYEDRLVLLLLDILLLINRKHQEIYIETNIQKEIDKAAKYFSENYNQEIVIADYAKEHYFSPYYFTRNFKEHIGYTPTQYIVSLRINNAQSMLATSNYSINEIASLVGYNDPLYFSRLFKKHVGYSPKEYRHLFHHQQNSLTL